MPILVRMRLRCPTLAPLLLCGSWLALSALGAQAQEGAAEGSLASLLRLQAIALEHGEGWPAS